MESILTGIKDIVKKLVIYGLAVGYQLFIGRMAFQQENFVIGMAVLLIGWLVSISVSGMFKTWIFARGGNIINFVNAYLLYANLGLILILYFLTNCL